MTTVNTKIPTRGERNNNPGNIERNTIKWLGMSGIQSDSRFCSFTTPAYGIRALGKLVTNYYHNYKLNTIAKIINRWAPAIENNTDAYINAVSTACSLIFYCWRPSINNLCYSIQFIITVVISNQLTYCTNTIGRSCE